jgi:hypothetical protein
LLAPFANRLHGRVCTTELGDGGRTRLLVPPLRDDRSTQKLIRHAHRRRAGGAKNRRWTWWGTRRRRAAAIRAAIPVHSARGPASYSAWPIWENRDISAHLP